MDCQILHQLFRQTIWFALWVYRYFFKQSAWLVSLILFWFQSKKKISWTSLVSVLDHNYDSFFIFFRHRKMDEQKKRQIACWQFQVCLCLYWKILTIKFTGRCFPSPIFLNKEKLKRIWWFLWVLKVNFPTFCSTIQLRIPHCLHYSLAPQNDLLNLSFVKDILYSLQPKKGKKWS